MANMEYDGWKLKVVTRDNQRQIECRKTFRDQCELRGFASSIMGQVLLIIALDGWKWNNETGTSDVRLSMNGPCPMTFDRLESFVRVADHARKILVKLDFKNLTLEEITTMLGAYYTLPSHGWPILLGKAGECDGVEQFIIYPKVLGAIRQMNDLFEGVGNVEIIQHEIGDFIAAPARPGD